MKKLLSLVQLVTKHRLNKSKIDPENPDIDIHFNKVFHGIANKSINSENQIAKEYLQCDLQDAKYRQFISRFKKETLKLIQQFDMDDANQNKAYREKRKCYQQMLAMQTLQANGLGEEAEIIARSLLLKSRSMNLLHIESECLDILSFQANMNNNINEYHKYKSEHEACMEQQYIQVKAMNLYNDVRILLEKTSDNKLIIKKTAKKKINEFISIKKKIKNENIEYNYYKLQVLYFQVFSNHKECIKVCNQALKWLESTKTLKLNYSILVYIEFQKLVTYLQLNNINKSELSANRCLEVLPKNDNNRLVVYDVYLLICINQRKYFKALEVYKSIREHPRSKFMGQDFNERLLILEGYLSFICSQYQILLNNDPVFNNLNHFDYDIFYKSVSVYKSDKKGLHVAMLILQILNYMQNNHFDKITSRMENLMKYRNKYLRKDENYRVNCFLKMINLIERIYNPSDTNSIKEIKTKATKYIINMNKYKIKMEKVYENYEIMSFEHLWEEIIKLLEKRVI